MPFKPSQAVAMIHQNGGSPEIRNCVRSSSSLPSEAVPGPGHWALPSGSLAFVFADAMGICAACSSSVVAVCLELQVKLAPLLPE